MVHHHTSHLRTLVCVYFISYLSTLERDLQCFIKINSMFVACPEHMKQIWVKRIGQLIDLFVVYLDRQNVHPQNIQHQWDLIPKHIDKILLNMKQTEIITMKKYNSLYLSDIYGLCIPRKKINVDRLAFYIQMRFFLIPSKTHHFCILYFHWWCNCLIGNFLLISKQISRTKKNGLITSFHIGFQSKNRTPSSSHWW